MISQNNTSILGVFFIIIFFVTLLLGSQIYTSFFTKPAPNLGSDKLRESRSHIINSQTKTIVYLKKKTNAHLIDTGYIDQCVHGFGGGMGKPGTEYTYKCVYKINTFLGVSDSFQETIQQIESELFKNKWKADDDTTYIISEYNSRINKFKSPINTLPSLEYYKDRQSINISFVELDPSKEDKSSPILSRIDQPSQIISGQMSGDEIYSKENYVDPNYVVQEAREKNYQFVLIIGIEGSYFLN